MTTPTTTTAPVYTPQPAEFGVARYGVHLDWAGDEDDVLAFGHHSPRRVIAAALSLGRDDCGREHTARWSLCYRCPEQEWVVVHVTGDGWQMTPVPVGAAGAVPVTWVSPECGHRLIAEPGEPEPEPVVPSCCGGTARWVRLLHTDPARFEYAAGVESRLAAQYGDRAVYCRDADGAPLTLAALRALGPAVPAACDCTAT